ncbi:hypothetical protein SPHINGO391_510192 [Sphingomonas aurantiaca]|jgi:hypothetical protein|uniref:Uncharacterized protein n=1 Tax=Sphingomonas aurantiaca TaxID=185949 RepID=A0A5E8AFA4_9SPHN|nr:hypothetical protein [Sphingomonas aurantiaca]VVT29899.1 hypothetical protein SPHINGO391_510192 [Sphingomonas aurantiaca]
MTAALRDWLLTCPEVKWISALALEAADAGLFDLRLEMAKAISGGVRMTSLGETLRVQPRAYYQRSARMLAHRRKGCSLTLVSDTVVLTGSIFQGVAISESRDSAVIYVRQTVPATAAVALVGRSLDDLIRIGRFKFGNYRITAAEQDEWGLAVWFDVPRLAFNHFV